MCYRLRPLLIVEEEARGEGMGRGCGEVELLLLVRIVRILLQKWNPCLKVSSDLLIGLRHRTARVVGLEVDYALLDVGNARIRGAGRGVVGQAEEVGQTEVSIGTSQESLPLDTL